MADTGRKLYIGGLLESVRKDDLSREFNKFGEIADIWVARNPPGFAFVEYTSATDAEKAVRALDGMNVCGSRIRVEFANTTGNGNGGKSGRGRNNYGGRREGGGNNENFIGNFANISPPSMFLNGSRSNMNTFNRAGGPSANPFPGVFAGRGDFMAPPSSHGRSPPLSSMSGNSRLRFRSEHSPNFSRRRRDDRGFSPESVGQMAAFQNLNHLYQASRLPPGFDQYSAAAAALFQAGGPSPYAAAAGLPYMPFLQPEDLLRHLRRASPPPPPHHQFMGRGRSRSPPMGMGHYQHNYRGNLSPPHSSSNSHHLRHSSRDRRHRSRSPGGGRSRSGDLRGRRSSLGKATSSGANRHSGSNNNMSASTSNRNCGRDGSSKR